MPPKIITAPYDVPKKLAAIDSFLTILKNEIHPRILETRLVRKDWNERIATAEGKAAYLAEIFALRQKVEDARVKINRIESDNNHFEDIVVLLRQDYDGFFHGVDQYRRTLDAIGDPPYNKMDLNFILTSPFYLLEHGAKRLEDWHDAKIVQARELRQQFSR